jgi:hypothetical protein
VEAVSGVLVAPTAPSTRDNDGRQEEEKTLEPQEIVATTFGVSVMARDCEKKILVRGWQGIVLYRPHWAHYLGGYQDRLLGGPLGLPDLRCTAPDGVKQKDCRGEVLG